MFQINDDMSIHATRGDVVYFNVSAQTDDEEYIFQPDDVVRMSIYAKKNCENVVLRKDFIVSEETESVYILLDKSDTTFGGIISKPVDYWYEIELNPDTNPQTIIGYDDDGAKVFKLYPEGDESADIEETDIPVVDNDFSETSLRPLQNNVITRKFKELEEDITKTQAKITSKDIIPITQEAYDLLKAKGIWEEDTPYIIVDAENIPDDENAIVIAQNALAIAQNANSTANNAYNISNGLSRQVTNAQTTANTALEEANKSAKTNTYFVTIKADKWTEDVVNRGYICTATVEGILATDNPIADIQLGVVLADNDAMLTAWALVTRIVTADGSVTLYANSDKPKTDITFQLKVVR